MKKSEWVKLAGILWQYAETNNGKISPLIKEMIVKINKNMEVIIDELDDDEQTIRSNRFETTNSTGQVDFNGIGEF